MKRLHSSQYSLDLYTNSSLDDGLSMSEGSRNRTGKLKKVTCRVCREEVNFQSYPDHLKVKHPQENPSNLRDYHQRPLFGPPAAAPAADAPAPAADAPAPAADAPAAAPPAPTPAKKRKTAERDGQDDEEEGEFETTEELTEAGDVDKNMSLDEEAEKDIQHERCDEREDKDEEVKTDVFEHLSLDEEPEGSSIDEESNDQNEEEAKETIKIEQVNHKLESILAKVQCKLDTSTCRSEAEILTKTLTVVEKRLEVNKDVKDLVTKLEDLKMTENRDKHVAKTDTIDEDAAINLARSLKQITEKVSVFVDLYDEDKVCCEVCNTTFKYEGLESDFT